MEDINIQKEGKGFLKGTRNGMNSHYNFRFDPRLGAGKCAAREVPCYCKSCKEQLEKPWDPKRPACEQEMFVEKKIVDTGICLKV